MLNPNFEDIIAKIYCCDTRYHPDAYEFVQKSLEFALKSMKRSSSVHITGKELLTALRAYTLKKFGPLSKLVLNEWGISSCEDFGHIIFNLVAEGFLRRTSADSENDFKNGFSFDDAFMKPFRPRFKNTFFLKPKTRTLSRKNKKPAARKAPKKQKQKDNLFS